MSDEVLPLPPGDSADPGEYRIVGGKRYITCTYFAADGEVTLPSGKVIRWMQVLVGECMLKLYMTKRARDN